MDPERFLTRLMKEMPNNHRINPPVDRSEVTAWRKRWPSQRLPKDLAAFYRRTNGIAFWVDEGSPEGYFRLLPLREVDAARRIMWGESHGDLQPEDVPYPHWLALSEHADGATYIVLDSDTHRYYLMDTCGADLSCPVGTTVKELLDFIWEDWVEGLKDDSFSGN